MTESQKLGRALIEIRTTTFKSNRAKDERLRQIIRIANEALGTKEHKKPEKKEDPVREHRMHDPSDAYDRMQRGEPNRAE